MDGISIIKVSKHVTFDLRNQIMEEVFFLVEESEEGGYTAKGLGVSIYMQADTFEILRVEIVDAVHCHFDDDRKRIIRLHIVREEIIAA
jgi:hypothetical protein